MTGCGYLVTGTPKLGRFQFINRANPAVQSEIGESSLSASSGQLVTDNHRKRHKMRGPQIKIGQIGHTPLTNIALAGNVDTTPCKLPGNRKARDLIQGKDPKVRFCTPLLLFLFRQWTQRRKAWQDFE